MKPTNKERSIAKRDAKLNAEDKAVDELTILLNRATDYLSEACHLGLVFETVYWKEYRETLKSIIKRAR